MRLVYTFFMNQQSKVINIQALRDGMLLLVDKPLDWTSFDVVAKLRGVMKRKLSIRKYKIGHAGTLDPLATGLLIICTGKLTKTLAHYQNQTKEYTGVITLGATTPSFDTETPIDTHFPVEHITEDDMDQARKKLLGTIIQNIPIYSAVKVDGQRMYQLARKGEPVKIKSREVEVHSFDIDKNDFPDLRFNISVSKGTYIRAIADDFGRLVESGGYLTELRRTKIGEYSVADAWSVDHLVTAIQELE